MVIKDLRRMYYSLGRGLEVTETRLGRGDVALRTLRVELCFCCWSIGSVTLERSYSKKQCAHHIS